MSKLDNFKREIMSNVKEFDEGIPANVHNVMKKAGVSLKTSTLAVLVGLGGKELDMVVKAVNALRPMIEQHKDNKMPSRMVNTITSDIIYKIKVR